MFEKLDEIKVLRDPIHGYIHVEYKVIWDCINSVEFQRLRRIKQQGSSFVVYHTAEHSRFSHSLGVYEIVRRMCEEIKEISNVLNEEEKVNVMLAGLLHDIGHGPFSHSFEAVSGLKHEELSCRILKEDTNINKILTKYSKDLSNNIADIISHKSSNTILTSMMSGQLDADRMDYLLRDSYFTGTKYGQFDLERILRTIRVKDNMLVIKDSGINSVEDYIMARYHTYWQVYYHPVARAFESIFCSLFKRMEYLYKLDYKNLDGIDVFKNFFNDRNNLNNYLNLDDSSCNYSFKLLINHKDKILSDLARRLVNRDLFTYEDLEDVDINEISKKLEDNGYDTKYYLCFDSVNQNLSGNEIMVLKSNGTIVALDKVSYIVLNLSDTKHRSDNKVFFPKGLL